MGSNPILGAIYIYCGGGWIINTREEGALGEARVVYEFQKYGVNVSKPLSDNAPYDLVIDVVGKLYKIQIKTSAFVENNATLFRLAKTRYNRTSSRVDKYTSDEVDYYALYSIPRDKVYIVAYNDAPSTEMSIRYDDGEGHISQKTMRYEENYSIDNVLGLKPLDLKFQKNKRLH